MEKCHSDVHDCGPSMYCDFTVNRCQDCHFICNKQRTPDFKECKELCFDFYKKFHDDTIREGLKYFTTNAATGTYPATILPQQTQATIFTLPVIIALIGFILVISVSLLVITVYCFTSKSKICMASGCFSNKQKMQAVYFMKADKNGKDRRSSDCSDLKYMSYRKEDRHRVQVAGAPLMQLGVSQPLHPHNQQHKSHKNSKVFDTGDENVALIHNCDVTKINLSEKQTIPLNLKEKQGISNYNNGNLPGIPGSGNSGHIIVNSTNNHNILNLNVDDKPSTSKVKGCEHNDDTRKQKEQHGEPKSGNTKHNVINKADADDTRSDYSSYKDDSNLSSTMQQVSVGVGSFTDKIPQRNAQPNSEKYEDPRNEVDKNNRKVITQSQRLKVSILDGIGAKHKPLKPDDHILHSTSNSKPVTPSQILFATNKDQVETAGRVVDSLSADVKGLPAPGNVKRGDKKQVQTKHAAEEQQNKDTLFAIDEYYSSHVKPDLAASELPHTPTFIEQSLLEFHRTGDVKNVSILNDAITPKGTSKIFDNEEVLKSVHMRTYTEPENVQVRRSSEHSSNGDTIVKSRYTVDGELIPQPDKLMSAQYINYTPVNQEIKMTPVNQHNNLTPVINHHNLTYFNDSNPATVNNRTFPHRNHGNGNPSEENNYEDSGILQNGQVESNIYMAPVYQISELNAIVCQPSDIGIQPVLSAVIDKSSNQVIDKVSKPKPHPNKRLYEVLKHIDWVDGYYSEGRSIEVYVDLEHITPEVALKELSVRTGAPPEKFHVKQNDSILA